MHSIASRFSLSSVKPLWSKKKIKSGDVLTKMTVFCFLVISKFNIRTEKNHIMPSQEFSLVNFEQSAEISNNLVISGEVEIII